MRVRVDTQTLSIAPIANARAEWNERRWCEVTLLDEQGREGQGVAAPLPNYSDETLEDALAELARFSSFVASEPYSSELIARALRKTPVMLPSVRFAIEVADAKLRAQSSNATFAELIAKQFQSQRHTPVRVACWLQAHEPPERACAFEAVKIKVGVSLQADLERIAAVRARAPQTQIRVDANRTLDPDLLLDIAGAFAHLGVTYLEEPCDPERLLTLAPLPIGLAFDETLSEPRGFALLKELREVQRVVALSIKPTRLGDFRNIAFWCRNAERWEAWPVLSHCLEPDAVYRDLLDLAALFPASIHGLAPHPALQGRYPVDAGAVAPLEER